MEAGDGPIRYGVLDSSLWHKRGDTGPSLAEQMVSRGCRWRPSDRSKGSRVAGKNEIHRRLQVDEFTEEPRLVFFNNCVNMVSQLPAIPLDKKNPEDIDTHSEDHLYDALDMVSCLDQDLVYLTMTHTEDPNLVCQWQTKLLDIKGSINGRRSKIYR